MPAGKTYTRVANQTLGSASASVTFSNLPQNFTDLVVVLQVKNSGGNGYATQLQYNGDTGNNYSWMGLAGYASSSANTYKGNNTNIQKIGFSSVTSGTVWAPMIVQIMNYSSASAFKTYVSRSNNIDGNSYVHMGAGVWRNTAAITSLTFTSEASSTFASGSTFTIYGIEAAKSPKAEGGDVIVSDGTYWYHAFRHSGSFVPRVPLTADVLVVAGGGAGGSVNIGTNNSSGGGGAGGLIAFTSQSLTTTNYAITIGAGGTASINSQTNGSDSQFASLTAAVGGGKGAQHPVGDGSNGGSGGGSRVGYTPGTGTAGQGNSGGTGRDQGGGGGGGGAGAAGSSTPANTNVGSAGGAGSSAYSSWAATTGTGVSGFYAGGGGGGGGNGLSGSNAGGAGGSGGGGAGGTYNTSNAVSGTTNTGGGGGGVGGGAGGTFIGGNGGSGVVIVRYSI